MLLTDHWDPSDMEDARDFRYTTRVMRRPRCEVCGEHLTTDEYLDLTPLGINGVLCEDCINDNRQLTSDLDDD